MTDAELDQLVSRVNTLHESQPGFRSAYVLSYAPPMFAIDFDNNKNADAYVFNMALAGSASYAVDPPNGSRVVSRR